MKQHTHIATHKTNNTYKTTQNKKKTRTQKHNAQLQTKHKKSRIRKTRKGTGTINRKITNNKQTHTNKHK